MAHSSRAIGRIRRIGSDTEINYSFLATSAYDATNPAATTGAWSDDEAMDQALYTLVPPGTEVTEQGILVTFERRVFGFWGIIAKVRPTYTDLPTITTAIEMWTHNLGTDVWTLRRRILFSDVFNGTPPGEAKFFDLRLATFQSNVDRVWITMAPDPADTAPPVMRFVAVHPFGQCHERIVTPGSCVDDPNIDCQNPGDCDPVDSDCLTPSTNCADYGPDVCELPPFDWPRVGRPDGGPAPSDPPVPATPLVDLCDPIALQAFKDSMTADQLAYFEDLLAQSELPCLNPADVEPPEKPKEPQQKLPINDAGDGTPLLPRQPVEVYVDPKTGRVGADPRNAVGGNPEASDSGTTTTFPFFVFYSEARRDRFVTTLAGEPAEVQTAWARSDKQILIWGLGDGIRQCTIAQMKLTFADTPPGARCGVRLLAKPGVQVFNASQAFPFVLLNPLSMPVRITGATPPLSPDPAEITITDALSVDHLWTPDTWLFDVTVEFSAVRTGSIPGSVSYDTFTKDDFGGNAVAFKPNPNSNEYNETGPSYSSNIHKKMLTVATAGNPVIAPGTKVTQTFQYGFFVMAAVFIPHSLDFYGSHPRVTMAVTQDIATEGVTDAFAVWAGFPGQLGPVEDFTDPYI